MKELRIGLVLYGGVSLAIYMNGISTELFHLLRASRARQDGNGALLDGTARIYAELLDSLKELTQSDLRVVVDAVAGTSAGGINGAVLAKAIVDGGDAGILNEVWLEDADISKLRAQPSRTLPWYWRALLCVAECAWRPLRELKARVIVTPNVSWRWLCDHLYSMIAEKDGQSTPLDGDYFTRMIARTLSKMSIGDALLPASQSFDLYLTRTDLHGWPRHLPVSRLFHAHPLYERTHAHVMHFRRKPGGGNWNNDFGLTYASRSTAGFPVAFAPVNYSSVQTAYRAERSNEPDPDIEQFADEHLPEHSLFRFPADGAWMIDGGVLDNKPFTHVTRAIERKPAKHQIFRVLAYVEPDPEDSLEPPATDASAPTASALLRDLYRLFRHEPIHEDLRRLQERNAKVEDIRRLLDANRDNALRAARAAGENENLSTPADPTRADDWRKATNAHAAKVDTSGYPGYVVLKARPAARLLAITVSESLGFPYESRQAYFIRRLVRMYLEQRNAFDPPSYDSDRGYRLSETQRDLFRAFDVRFRLRRLRAMVHATNDLYEALHDDDPPPRMERERLDSFKSKLERAALAFERLLEDHSDIRQAVQDTPDVDAVLTEINRRIDANDFDVNPVLAKYGRILDELYERLGQLFRQVSDNQDNDLTEALAALPAGLETDGYRPIMDAFVMFPFIDIVVFPLMEAAGIGDLIQVEAMRISPRDVPRNDSPPLKSRGLGGFQGFLERSAREHDMKLGRQDGAERLLSMIMKASEAERHDPQAAGGIRSTYAGQLHAAI